MRILASLANDSGRRPFRRGIVIYPYFSLQLLFRKCILDFPVESHADNLDARLWRHCFYQPIDFYRRQLKDAKSPLGRWALSQLNRLIDSGLAFLISLLFDLASFGINKPVELFAPIFSSFGFPLPLKSSARPGLEDIIYRMLIFAGDLARYRCQFNRQFQKDQFHLAWVIYQTALKFEPAHGHAANQLAVVGSLLNDVIITSFWYLRAECCALPFSAAHHNLLTYLQKSLSHSESIPLRPFISLIYDFIGSAHTPELHPFTSWLDSNISTISCSQACLMIAILATISLRSPTAIKALDHFLNTLSLASRDASIFVGSEETMSYLILCLLTILKVSPIGSSIY